MKILNLIDTRLNNPELYKTLIEHECAIFIDHKCIYEGIYDKSIGIDIEDLEKAIIIFNINEKYCMMTISKNESLNNIIDIFEEYRYDYDKVMSNPKLYNKIVNLSFNIPEFPTIKEGNNIQRLLEIIKEDEEDESIPGDGLPSEDDKQKQIALKRRGDIVFTIWESPDKKLDWVNDNTYFQKIQYIYSDKSKGLNIDFLLGYKDGSWKLWCGKLGSVSYSDDPYKDFKTKDFGSAISQALDEVEEIIKNVEENPDEWPQFYVNI